MSILRWPDRDAVVEAARRYARRLRATHPEVQGVFLFGSFAEGSAGVGSDADLLIEVRQSTLPRWKRPLAYDPPDLPVPEDCIVLTSSEIEELRRMRPHFREQVLDRMVRLD